MYPLGKCLRPPIEPARRYAVDRINRIGPFDVIGSYIPIPNADISSLSCETKPFFILEKLTFGAFAFHTGGDLVADRHRHFEFGFRELVRIVEVNHQLPGEPVACDKGYECE